jgi:hypothetical protein
MITEYYYILSLAWNLGSASAQGTFAGVFIPENQTTTYAAYLHIYKTTRERMGIKMENPTVLFFSLEPNTTL